MIASAGELAMANVDATSCCINFRREDRDETSSSLAAWRICCRGGLLYWFQLNEAVGCKDHNRIEAKRATKAMTLKEEKEREKRKRKGR